MDLDLDPADEAFRGAVRAWLAKHVPDPPLASVNTAGGFAAHREWERQLAAGLAVISWPRRYGGQDVSLARWLVLEEEYYRAGAPVRVGQNGLILLAPTLFAHSTAEQRDRVLPPMATAEQVWAQAWSEPGAGSDLAAIRSAATRVDGGWLLSGQHALADVLVGLEFARPLLFAAAIAVGKGAATTARDVAAARVACADAARRAARTALQVHGAIGYTQECDVSLWLGKVRALSSAWGSQAEHRATVLAALAEPETGPWS